MITARRLPFDPLLAAMAAGLALAVGAMAYPAFRGNPWSAPGMILILTAGLIALVGLFGFRRAEAGRPASDVAVDLLDGEGFWLATLGQRRPNVPMPRRLWPLPAWGRRRHPKPMKLTD